MSRTDFAKLLKVSGKPKTFSGTIKLPPSKSYLHRALFVSAVASGTSTLTNCGSVLNEDIKATMGALVRLGTKIRFARAGDGTIKVLLGTPKTGEVTLDAGGSGTTARFLVPFCALSPSGMVVKIVGNDSLSRRPMDTIFNPLLQLGVKVRSLVNDGRLPIVVDGGGMSGGECEVDGSISSQFVSSLLISCVKARRDSKVTIKNPEDQVSAPYIDATILVLRKFGFNIQAERTDSGKYASFKIPGNQTRRGRRFAIPGDLSSAAPLLGAAIATGGEIRLRNSGGKDFPQADRLIVSVSRKLGANVKEENGTISLRSTNRKIQEPLSLDMRDSPDLVPTIAGLAVATNTEITISNVAHLRFKESDRISVLSRELSKLGVKTEEDVSTLRVLGLNSQAPKKNNILINPQGDHRMLMALTIAGLSGRFGTIYIEDPDCVRKSFPSFIPDLQKLCHEKSTLKLVSSSKI